MELHLAPEWLNLEKAIGYRPRMSGSNVQEVRDALALMTNGAQNNALENPDINVYETAIDSTHAIKVRVYEPRGVLDEKGTTDVALFFHGGGWCIGDLDLEHDLVKFMATKTGMKFVSVDYRLAPEHPWPAQLEDCIDAVQWVRKTIPRSNSQAAHNPTQLFLVGTSAGAHLALSVATKLSHTLSSVQGVVALAPFTIQQEDAVKLIGRDVASHSENADAPILSLSILNMFLEAARAPIGDPAFSILLSPYLPDMPPTYIVTCGADILRDHGLLLKEQLEIHDVPVKLCNYPGYPHTFWATPGLQIVNEFRSDLLRGIEFIRKGRD